jgi:FliI/YscN family ATPase
MSLDPVLCARALEQRDLISGGRVVRVFGDAVHAVLPKARIGEIYRINQEGGKAPLLAEVIGFTEHQSVLAPFGVPRGIGPGMPVIPEGATDDQYIGDSWIGRILDSMGKPIDDGPPIQGKVRVPLYRKAPNPMRRAMIDTPLHTGVGVLDMMATVGRGQRLGIFAAAGAGKSTLLAMIARNSSSDVNVIALVGERGREVRSFIRDALGEEGLKRSVVLVAPGDASAILRIRVAFLATAVAEYFRDQGKHVVLLMDSLTRLAHAGRETGLAAGEPPATRGYPPSVFAMLPKLIERAGNGQGSGSLTAFYAVLVEGDDLNEPISDAVRGILDGHLVLSRKLAEANHYPAVNILGSLSRLAEELIDDHHASLVEETRDVLSTYAEVRDLVQIGAYRPGTDPKVDRAITLAPKLADCFKQGRNECRSFEQSLRSLEKLLGPDLHAKYR